MARWRFANASSSFVVSSRCAAVEVEGKRENLVRRCCGLLWPCGEDGMGMLTMDAGAVGRVSTLVSLYILSMLGMEGVR